MCAIDQGALLCPCKCEIQYGGSTDQKHTCLSTIQKWGTCKNQLHSCVLFLLYMYIITAIVHGGDKEIKSK